MTVPTLTITEEAYRKLARLKRSGESFSEVTNRTLGRPSALELAGVLGPAAGDQLVREVRRARRDWDKRTQRPGESPSP